MVSKGTMETERLLELYKKFPAVLQSKLIAGEIKFPRGAEFNYEKILAYRAVRRASEDCSKVSREDMLSYVEESRRYRGRVYDEKDPSSYAVSLYSQSSSLKNSFKFPRKGWKIARGYVRAEGGPHYLCKKNFHIDWWIYEGFVFDDFLIKEDWNG